MADTMKRFDANKVRMSTHLLPLSEKQKARLRTERGVKQRFASDVERSNVVNKEREYYAPVRADWVPSRKRGASGTRLSPMLRAIVAAKRKANQDFHAELRKLREV